MGHKVQHSVQCQLLQLYHVQLQQDLLLLSRKQLHSLGMQGVFILLPFTQYSIGACADAAQVTCLMPNGETLHV